MMRNLIITLFLMVADCSALAQTHGDYHPKTYTNKHVVEVLKVVDGDSIQINAPWVPEPMPRHVTIRVFGIDTPEKAPRAKCKDEAEMAKAASALTTSLVKQAKRVEVVMYKWDKYGGRILGDVFIDGQDLRTILIKKGLAVAYYGDKKQSWCN